MLSSDTILQKKISPERLPCRCCLETFASHLDTSNKSRISFCVQEVKIKFDPDVDYWFNAVEAQMKKFGINSQWEKKNAIVPLLPDDIIDELKPLLRLKQQEAGAIYKRVKTEIIQLYGPRDEEAFQKALALRLTGKPSALAKKIIHLICPGSTPLDGCHCAKTIFGMWHAQLPQPIRNKLAGQKFNKDTYQDMLKQADEVWISEGGTAPQAPVVGAVTVPATPAEQPVAAVAAVGRGQPSNRRGNNSSRGRGGRGRGPGNSNNNRQNQNNTTSTNSSSYQPKPHQKGPRHSDSPPDQSCSQHWSKGRSATYCTDPLNCPWVKIIAPRPSSTSSQT